MATAAARRAERRKNLIALAIAFGIVVLAALFAWRPAPLLGVSEGALAHSVAGEVDVFIEYGAGPKPACSEGHADRWTCVIRNPSDSEHPVATYTVRTTGVGCWDARGAGEHLNGCISIFDY